MVSAPAQDDALHLNDLEEALATLPVQQREALLLIGREGLAYEEAAGLLGVKVGTLKSRVARARLYHALPGQRRRPRWIARKSRPPIAETRAHEHCSG
ncbi:sigma factor-like helix-turn-helix DNA-binding protein [Sphingomonas oryzagri]